jgi:hypothetical protein
MSTTPPPGGYPAPAQHLRLPPAPSLKFLLPRSSYTPWLTRVAATLIDSVPVAAVLGVGWAAGEVSSDCGIIGEDLSLPGYCSWAITDSGEYTSTSTVIFTAVAIFSLASYLLAFAYWMWNLAYRQGKTGSSIGKSLLKFKVVSDKTWQPIGFGQSVARQFAHIIDYCACYVGYLWPLWDPQRQTLADKVMSTVCVPLDSRVPGTLGAPGYCAPSPGTGSG